MACASAQRDPKLHSYCSDCCLHVVCLSLHKVSSKYWPHTALFCSIDSLATPRSSQLSATTLVRRGLAAV